MRVRKARMAFTASPGSYTESTEFIYRGCGRWVLLHWLAWSVHFFDLVVMLTEIEERGKQG